MSSSKIFVFKEGWNDLDMNGEFQYGFSNMDNTNLHDLTEVDLSKYQGTKMYNKMFVHSGFKNVVIPDTIKEIGIECFRSCINLINVHFGKNIKKIGSKAFLSCNSLEEINLPEGVEEIGERAFYIVLCPKLVLPSTIKKLDDYCYTSTNTSTVRFQSLEPPIMSKDALYNVNRIEVPMAAVESYKNINVEGWKETWGDKIVGY